jgi:hypothetical protein
MSNSSVGSNSSALNHEVTALPLELDNGTIKVGHIYFDPAIILGKGCEGTFVYKGNDPSLILFSKASSRKQVLKCEFSKLIPQIRLFESKFSKASSRKQVLESEFSKVSSQKRVLESKYSKASS